MGKESLYLWVGPAVVSTYIENGKTINMLQLMFLSHQKRVPEPKWDKIQQPLYEKNI